MQPLGFREYHTPIGWGILVFPCFFVVVWCLTCLVISRSGWSDWARIYRCDRKLQGTTYRGRSGRFTFQASYKGILRVVLCQDGIGLSVAFPWRVGHPPLLLPWSKVSSVTEKDYFFFRLLQITISDVDRTFTFELPLPAKSEFETRALSIRC